jgi:N-formylglutamate amidohydrolase
MVDVASLYRCERPRGAGVPVLVEVPHAGTTLTDEARASLIVDTETVHRDADTWVDRVWHDAPSRGATLLVATLSRYVVDLNREAHDIDEWSVRDVASSSHESPRGVIWRQSGDGRPALRAPLTRAHYNARIAHCYDPYHQRLAEELNAMHVRHKHALLIAAHSMPSTGKATRGGGIVRRADVVPGSRGRSTAAREVLDTIEAHFRAAGLSVRHDDPYRGGATTARWGRPHEGLHAVQIEFNRALYMNERTLALRPDGIAWLAGLSVSLIPKLAATLAAM